MENVAGDFLRFFIGVRQAIIASISEVKDCGAGPNKRNKLKLDATSHVRCSPVPNLNPNDSITKLNKSITIFGG
ncbi:MAG: hypothetical protein ACOWW1_05955 [archaeon]|nr:hypothetical protein [Candidatus Bathyarchaeum sp.]